MTSTAPTRILILGGGFGGVYTALTLERILKRELKRGEVEIALVSRDNYLTFQPMPEEMKDRLHQFLLRALSGGR